MTRSNPDTASSGIMVIAYMAMALSGFIMGVLVGWLCL